jgi:hypothetical protein
MAVVVGGTYYFKTHAYYHVIGTVTEILGVRRVALSNVVKVHSCSRNWTEFFRDGFRNDTRYDMESDIADTGYITANIWAHPLPKEKGR